MIYVFTSYIDQIPLDISELAIHVTFIVSLEEASQDVVFQFGDEGVEYWIGLVFMDV